MLVYLNGSYLDHTDAAVSVGDRGFVFGDGIYEVVRVVEGNFFMENEHLERMDEGLSALKIDFDKKIRDDIPSISRKLIKENSLEQGESKVYIQVTRGAVWPRTHEFPDPPIQPTVYLSADPFKPHKKLHKSGVDAITASDVRWSRCNLKTVNLLPNTLVKQQAKEAGVDSAVMIRDGVVTESPNANIFGVKDGTLFTYPATNYILNGITRRAVIKIAEKLNLPVNLMPISEQALFELDELFFSGTTTDIQPVTIVDGRKIGIGKPGPVVKKIQKAYDELLNG
ncbi:aminotransferase class IV [soil metagenome]